MKIIIPSIALVCVLIFLIGAWSLFGTFFDYDCSETSEAVAFARSLPAERLEKLYYDMERLSADKSFPTGGYASFELNEGEKFPEPFSDLEAVKIRPRDGNIMIEGCFDHYVMLYFEGYGRMKELQPDRRIILAWGEWEPDAGTQILWQEAKIEPVDGGQ